ncbi:hypothetical protein HII36_04455 [Nonomuraea sp. NN258]|uniref:hypothetical protein n=1 Tax=Nonomuraea antri TaxID=2730852 RepID=UPI00156A2FEA|nr:hypothetical protein [Nonomuraea antri]NRQ31087.1 hypothetical protein [Nonomuraea antri]
MSDDEYFLAALRLAAGHDPIPDHVSLSGRDVYGLRIPQARTATPAEAAATSGVRGPHGSHLVRFQLSGFLFDLEVTVGDGLIDVAGHVSPLPEEGTHVDVRTPHLTLSRRLQETGQFAVTGLPPGWLSVVCYRPGRAPVQSKWVRIRP